MNHHITSFFSITSWDEQAYEESVEAPKLSRATVKKAFTGELTAESTAELLMCRSGDEGAGYVASERIVGRIGDREGSFVVQHGGIVDGAEIESFGHVVPASGTGDFAGLRGKAKYQHDENGAVFTLDYSFV